MKTPGISSRVKVLRREARRLLAVSRNHMEQANRYAQFIGEPGAMGMLYSLAMAACVGTLLAAQRCRDNARLLAGCVPSTHDHCESCDGAGRGTSVYGDWICSSCHGYGTRKGAA